jgi:hypothetical protein
LNVINSTQIWVHGLFRCGTEASGGYARFEFWSRDIGGWISMLQTVWVLSSRRRHLSQTDRVVDPVVETWFRPSQIVSDRHIESDIPSRKIVDTQARIKYQKAE